VELNHKKTSAITKIGTLDISKLLNQVNNLKDNDWDTAEEFEVNYNKTNVQNNQNSRKALHDTKHIIFRFVNKQQSTFEYIQCSRWEKWSSILLPIMDQATEYLAYENRFYPKVMLANLPAKKFIKPHKDGDKAGYIPHKIHVPLKTNADAFFFLENERHHFEEGVAYEVNNGKRHSVVNNGDSDRIHLIFECLDFDLQTREIQEQIISQTKS